MPPKKGKKNVKAKKVEEVKPKETKLTSASKPRGSSRNSIDKLSTPNPPKQEEITAYLKEDNHHNNHNVKNNQSDKIVEDGDKNNIDLFVSPKKDTQNISQMVLNQKTTQSKLNTPAAATAVAGTTPGTQSKGTISQRLLESKSLLFTPSKMNKKTWKVCLSGFTKQTKEFNKNAILELKGEYCENIQPGLDVVISSKAFTMKTKNYKTIEHSVQNALSLQIRQILLILKKQFCQDSGIPIVSVNWLTDSMKEKYFLEDLNKYKLKTFEGCKLNILGFSEEEYMTIKETIMSLGGDCINDLNEAQKPANPQIDITVLNSTNNSNSYLNIIKTPATDEKWLKESLKRQIFVYPKHYIINKLDLNQYNLEKEDAISQRMQEVECSSQDYNYLQSCVFYIHSRNLDDKKYKIITHLISIGGGYYINQILPSTTHIITPQYSKQDYSDFIQYGNTIFLVHPEWLQESFFVCKKLNEVDYQPQQIDYNTINSQSQNSQDQKQRNENGLSQSQIMQEVLNGISYHRNRTSINNGIFNNNYQTTNTLSRLNSINQSQFNGMNQAAVALPKITEQDEKNNKEDIKPKKQTFKQQKKSVVPISNIFKNCSFYLEQTQYKSKLNQFKQKIFENQGDILSQKDNKIKEIFHILDDSPSNVKIMANKAPNVYFFSYRWIDFCIEKKTVVRAVQELQLIHLLPFEQEMPIKEFQNISIWCSGYSINEKHTLKETIKIIGANLEFTEGKTEYLITDKKDCKKIRKLQEYKEMLSKEEYEQKWGQIKIVSTYWILDCVSSGKKIEPEYYQI